MFVRVPTALYGASVAAVLGLNAFGLSLYVRRVEDRPGRVEPAGKGHALPSPGVWLDLVQGRLEDIPGTKELGLKLDAVRFQDGSLRLEGVVPRTELKAQVEQMARDVARDLKVEVHECRNDLRDPLDLVRAAIARDHPTVRLNKARILEQNEDGKKKRVVALTGSSPTRAARFEVAETARKVLNEHGFAVEEWDAHDLRVEADRPKSK
jgi:hypothetical protein